MFAFSRIYQPGVFACRRSPDDTPWEGGIFHLKITFSESYPGKPPRVRFTSELFHPNIFKDGNICLDIIQVRRHLDIPSVL